MGQGSSKRKQAQESNKDSNHHIPPVSSSGPLTWGYSCDLCLKSIPGVRFSCSTCRHFDICPTCKEQLGHEHLLYEETLHPQLIFDQLYVAPTSGQALLKMFQLYSHRRAFAFRKEQEVVEDLRVSVDDKIAQETSESQIQVSISREIPIPSSGDSKKEDELRNSSFIDKTPLPPFEWITFGELGNRVINVGKGLRQLVQAREFVGICSHVQLGWYIADYACQVNSIIGPTLGPTLSVEAFAHIINSTSMKVVFCAKTLTNRFIEISAQCPTLKYIIQIEDLSDYQKRPKVEAAKQGLRESAKRNFLKSSIKSASNAGSSTQQSSNNNSSDTSSSKTSTNEPASADTPSETAASESSSSTASTSTTNVASTPDKTRDFRNDVDFGAILQREDIEQWKATLLESGGPVLLCLSDLERLGEIVEDPEVVITGPDELETLVYTSGSTGIPKGAMFTAKSWHSQLCHRYAGSGIDTSITWSISDRKNDFRHLYYGGAVAIYNGNMARIFDDIAEIKPDQLNATPAFWNKLYAEFKAELADATKHLAVDAKMDPDSVYDFPATSSAKLNDMPPILDANNYSDPVEFRRIRDAIFESFRQLVGGRIERIVTGGAPTSPEVMTFLNMCFKCKVRESYGSTECGGIVSGGLFVASLNWKLVSWEEYKIDDKPFARGELCVRRADMMSGYYGEKELTEEALDEDGYYHTGDIVELNANQDGATIIDRKKNIFKLAQGEYVAPAKIEKLLIGNSPFVKQVFVYGDSFKSSLVAVIVPHRQALADHLARLGAKSEKTSANSASSSQPNSSPSSEDIKRLSYDALCKREDALALFTEECGRIGRQFSLRTFEIPAALFLTPTEFTKENGLCTQSDKPARHSLLKHFSQEIERLYRSLESQLGETKEAVYQLLGKTLTSEVDFASMAPDDDDENSKKVGGNSDPNLVKKLNFVQMGGDSLTAVKLRNMIKKEFDVALPVDILMNPDNNMDTIAAYIDESKRNKNTVSNGNTAPNHVAVDLRTLMVDSKLDPSWKPAGPNGETDHKFSTPSNLPLSKWETVFLTGTTGFLGTALLAEILKSTTATVHCLVRSKKSKSSVRPTNADFTSSNSTSDGQNVSSDEKKAKEDIPTADLSKLQISTASQNLTETCEDFLKMLESRLLQSGLLGDSLDSMSKVIKKPLRQRIVPVVGRLDSGDSYDFGIDAKVFEELCKSVQIIIHAGAEVNTVLPYQRLAKSNVTGTKSCLNMCSHGRRKHLIHISTTGLTQALQNRSEVPITEELLALYPRLAHMGGYNLSKLMAELAVWEAIDRGYDATVVRPGFIGSAAGFVSSDSKSSGGKSKGNDSSKGGGSSSNSAAMAPFSGFSNTNDFDNRLIIGLTMMGIVPEESSCLITFPVDFMAKVIVTIASKVEKTNGKVYHLANNMSELTSDLIVQGLHHYGFNIESVPFKQWQQSAREMTDESNPIYPMVDEYFSHQFHRRHASNDITQTQLFISEHVGLKMPRTDLPFVLNWIAWLIKNGFLPNLGASKKSTASSSSASSNASSSNSASSSLFNMPSSTIGSAVASSHANEASSKPEKKKSKK